MAQHPSMPPMPVYVSPHLSDPGAVQVRLEEIDHELAEKQNSYEAAALAWYRAKRDLEKRRAECFLTAKGSVEARKALSIIEAGDVGKDEEAAYEALKAGIRVRETRVSIGQSLLKAQSV